MGSTCCVVYVTCASISQAEAIAERVIEERLAACVNLVGNVTSVYRWQGELRRDPEILMILKTDQRRVPALQERIKSLHDYTVPEFLVLPVLEGSREYLDWVKESVK